MLEGGGRDAGAVRRKVEEVGRESWAREREGNYEGKNNTENRMEMKRGREEENQNEGVTEESERRQME